MNPAATRKASPMTVKSILRSETKIAAGRHFTYGAGTTATEKHAIANESPSTISSEPTPNDPSDFGWNTLLTPAPTGGEIVTFGWTVGFFLTAALGFAFFG